MTEYRASFDATVTFANGGGLAARGFRVDVPSPGIDEAGIAALFVASLGLLMTESVELANVEIIAEPHKGTRGGPSDTAWRPAVPRRHAGRAQPRDPGRDDHLSRAARPGDHPVPDPGSLACPLPARHRVRDLAGISLVGNTGTYLDAPYHRYAGGADLTGIPLERTADLPAVVVRVTGAQRRGIGVGALAALDVRGAVVLLHTGDDTRFGTPAYAEDGHFLTEAGAAWLAGHEAALVGIDAVNIDDTADGRRPAHSWLLAAGIPVVEHLTGLGQLPPGWGPVHRRAAAHRGIRHDPGARVRAAARVGGATRPAGQFEDW